MIPTFTCESEAMFLSIGIFAWNEEGAIARTLKSLFEQTSFEELSRRNLRCEIVCVTNGCTDRTPAIAKQVFDEQLLNHPFARSFVARVVEITQRGKVNAWNKFVHDVSAREARYLLMMDSDILIHRRETLWNMVATLEHDSQAVVAVDRPCKDILFRSHRSWRDWFSLAVSQITLATSAQLCAQLYCMRTASARRIYMPKQLPACEDGFIKSLVCTENLSDEILAERIVVAKDAEHTFEAYTSPSAILKNQKRQVIGQTIIHLLLDKFIPGLPSIQREHLAETLRGKDTADPDWLKRLTSEHLRRTRWFWRLYPGLVSYRFRRLRQLKPLKQILCLPAAIAGTAATLVGSALAYRTLKAGSMDYWPRVPRFGLGAVESEKVGVPLMKSTGPVK
jgi:glycosyltransferase involved in cell wall biosynthesis